MPTTISVSSLGTSGIVIAGAGDYAQIGRSVSSAGDFNGDGIDDFIFTGPITDAVNNGRGITYLIFGRAGGIGPIDLAAVAPSDGFAIYGPLNANSNSQSAGVDMNAAAAGDVNGDGYGDIIIGEPRNGQDGFFSGRAYVLYGHAGTSGTVDLGTITAAQGAVIRMSPTAFTGTDGAFVGSSVASAGDINNDGIDDVIIGANQDGSGGNYAGRAFVLYGSLNGIGNINLATLTPTQGFALQGTQASGFAGLDVAGLGDVNGDGIDDLAVSAPNQDGGTGNIYVYYGKTGGLTSTTLAPIAPANGFIIHGASAQTRTGWSLSSAGDVNGDGRDDIIFSNGAFATGFETYLIFGQAGGIGTLNLASLSASQGFKLQPATPGSLGGQVSAAGDVDGDGFDDLLIGVGNGDLSGNAYVIYGNASISSATLGISDGLVIVGTPATGDAFGMDVASAGDVNGDGAADLIIGAWRGNIGGFARGAAYIIYGVLPTTAVTLTGTVAGQSLVGGALDDTLYGLGGDDRLYGNGGTDLLFGGAGNDFLQGGAGADSLTGGTGNDIYVVDALDTVLELPGEGTDTVRTAIASYALQANFENLVYTGTGPFAGTGNAESNRIYGGVGSDTLNGLANSDWLQGGGGDDVYFVDVATDAVFELPNEGNDVVYSTAISYALSANLEQLVLDIGAVSGTGNASDNALYGNAAANQLNGADGNDILLGNAGDDVLIGGNGNDNLNGGAGVDIMTGGAGNDVYIVDTVDDQVFENAGEGNDVVYTSGNYTLRAGVSVEVLLTDAPVATTAINLSGNEFGNAITGNAGANILLGNGGDDALIGLAGNDTLDGGAGLDITNGGLGDDIHIVDSADDVVLEAAGEGRDLVFASASYVLRPGVSVELLLTTNQAGTAAINLSGNEIDNIIQGNAGSNILFGGGGADVLLGFGGDDFLNGGTGADIMTGGLGDDIYFTDTIDDIVLENAGEGRDIVYTTSNYTLRQGVSAEFLLADPASSTAAINLSGNEIANTIQGNAGDNILFGGGGDDLILGNAGNDTLDGGAGADTLIGGTGDDVYFVDNAGDVVSELASEGRDTVYSSISYTLGSSVHAEVLIADPAVGAVAINLTGNGNANTIQGNAADNMLSGGGGDDVLVGGAGNDALDGGTGADTMIGGLGNDVYFVDNASDVIVENASEGTDSVYASANYTLANGVEIENIYADPAAGTALILLSGNSLANSLYGRGGIDVLSGGAGNDQLFGYAGDDRLDGGVGDDIMTGGLGDDYYFVDSVGDVIVENAGEGYDYVFVSLSDYTLPAGLSIEGLAIADRQSTTAQNLTGNELSNLIDGSDGANTIDGGDGPDLLYGEGGNDILLGGNGIDLLFGQGGNDTMTGGAGADRFRFDTSLATAGIDTITDFAPGSDSISLNLSAFAALTAGPGGSLPASAFVTGTAALDADDRIIYNSATGALFYDADGNGAGAASQFATLTGAPALTASDIVVF
jgi:Ca2+-binding RTX toxin-like protein